MNILSIYLSIKEKRKKASQFERKPHKRNGNHRHRMEAPNRKQHEFKTKEINSTEHEE